MREYPRRSLWPKHLPLISNPAPWDQPAPRQESGVWTPEHAPSFYRPGGNPSDNPSALQIIQEMRGEYNPDDEACPGSIPGTNPLPVSVHTKSLSRKEAKPDPLLPASTDAEDPPFAAEIDSLQFALQRLQLAFPRVASIDELLRLAVVYPASHRPACLGFYPALVALLLRGILSGAINLIYSLSRILCGTSIARMVRIQKYIASNRPVKYNREIQAALEVVMKEWTRTT